jgi:hypothetical protein
VIEGWLVFKNDLLGYEFSYPPQATIGSSGPDGYSPDEVPPDLKFDYFDLLHNLYSDDLCVGLAYETGFITIIAPLNRGGRFVTCGVTGVGEVDLVRITETIVIDGQTYTAGGHEAHARDAAATFLSEVLVLSLEDGTQIQYGGHWSSAGATNEADSPVKETLRRILASFHRTSFMPDCATGWSQLYPGIFAVVTGGPDDPPNRVRSAPDTGANVLDQISPGQIVVVLEGPACAGNLVFWKVQSDAIPGGVGWTAEGDGVAYYLSPYKQ